MSVFPSPDLSSVDSSLLTGALPPINPVFEPASVRNGSPAAKQAYEEALSFEDMLVNQLAQEMSSTVSGSSDEMGIDDSDDDDSDDDSDGIMGSDPASSTFASMIPDALTSGIMSAGGTGLALQLAQAIDPSLADPASAETGGAQSSSGDTSNQAGGAGTTGGAAL
jgi:hypothetical protein